TWNLKELNTSGYYLSGVDYATVSGSIFLKSDPKFEYNITDQYETLVSQSFFPQEFFGKRVQVTGFVKSSNVKATAGMFLQVYRTTNYTIAMSDPPIKGSVNWQKVKNVLDVPQDTIKIAFGSYLYGTGKIWICGFKFDIVDLGVPMTKSDIVSGSFYKTIGLSNYPTDLFELTPVATDNVTTKTDVGVVTGVAIGCFFFGIIMSAVALMVYRRYKMYKPIKSIPTA
ncbi:6338_t:CDS:2, partial [Acaulospora morrowiae]